MAESEMDLARHALEVARNTGARCVSIKQGDWSFSAVISEEGIEPAVEEAPEVQAPAEKEIKATAVGYFTVTEDAAVVGAEISAGTKIGEILALGIVNEIATPHAGTITEIFREDGAAVQYGQVLMKVKQ